MNFALIVAVDKNNGMGKSNAMVWSLPADLKHFARMTTEVSGKGKINAVIMGSRTWESLPPKHRPLKLRLNIILSRKQEIKVPPDVLYGSSLDEAIQKASSTGGIEKIFVIGGARVFEEAIKHPGCKTIYLTRLEQSFDCDVFFPQIDENIFALKERSGMKHENGIDFEFLTYERRKG